VKAKKFWFREKKKKILRKSKS